MPWKSQEGIVFIFKPVSVWEANTVYICIALQKGMGKMVPAYNVNVNGFCRSFRVGSKRILGYIQSCHIMVAHKGPNCTGVLHERANPCPQYLII